MAEEPAPFGGRVVRGVDSFLDVAARLGEHLPHLARHRVGDLLLALDQKIADAAEHVAARRRRRARPEREAAPRRAHGGIDVAASESGNRPIRSPVSAGLRFSKYAPVGGATHSPPMKLRKVLAMWSRKEGVIYGVETGAVGAAAQSQVRLSFA